MYLQPETSPWGKVQHCEELSPGIFAVSTASHGGIMVKNQLAKVTFSPAARRCAFQEAGYTCFEEDCAAAVALREMVDKKLYRAPQEFEAQEYSDILDQTIQQYYPEYWDAHEKGPARSERNWNAPER